MFKTRPLTTQASVRLIAELPEARSYASKLVTDSLDYVAMQHPSNGHRMYVLAGQHATHEVPYQNSLRFGLDDTEILQLDVILGCPASCNGNAEGVYLNADGCDLTYGHCKCKPGYYRDDCRLRTCPSNCNGRGSCDPLTGQCTCTGQFAGEACERITCTVDCSGPHGLGFCDESTGRCSCFSPAFGEVCEQLTCPNNCTFPNGFCDTSVGQCICAPGRLFDDCSGAQCSSQTATASIVRVADPTAADLCAIPHDNDDLILSTAGIDCTAAASMGFCGAEFVRATCKSA